MSVDTTLYIDTNDNKDLHIVLDAIMKALKGMNFFTNKSPYSDKLCFNGEITFNLISKNGLSGFFVFCTDSNFDDGRWRNLFISTNVVNYTYDIPNDRKWVYLSLKHDEQAVEILTGVAHHIKSNIGADTYLIPKDCDDENIIGF